MKAPKDMKGRTAKCAEELPRLMLVNGLSQFTLSQASSLLYPLHTAPAVPLVFHSLSKTVASTTRLGGPFLALGFRC